MTAARVLLLVLFSLAGCAGGPAPGEARTAPNAFNTWPRGDRSAAGPIRGELLDGSDFDPGTLAGTVVVVNFWASWCAPCRAEAGELNEAARVTGPLGVRFLGVNVRDSRDAARAFVAGREQYPSLHDPSGRVVLGFATISPNTLPATVITDRSGKVAVVIRKAVTARELIPLIRTIAAEKA